MSEMTIGNGDASGTHDGIDEAVLACIHGNMVDPYMRRAEDGDTIAIALCSKSIMINGISNIATGFGDDIMDVKAMDDNIVGELNGEASAIGNVNIKATSIDGLVA